MQVCPGCKNEIPSNVVTCPHCRYWMRGVLENPEPREEDTTSAEDHVHVDNMNSLDTNETEERLWGEMHLQSTAEQVLGILRSAFVIWRHLLSFLIMLAVISQLSSIPIRLLFAKANIQPLDFEKYTTSLIMGLALAVIVGAPLILGAWTAALESIDAVVHRRKISKSAFNTFLKSFRHFRGMLISRVIVVAAMIAAISPVILAAYWTKNGGSQALAGVLFVVGCIGLVYIYVKTAVVAPSVVLEGQTPVSALLRSSALVRGRFATILGVTTVYWFFVIVVQSVASIFMVSPMLGEIAGTAVSIVFITPFFWAVNYCIFKALVLPSAKHSIPE